MGRNSMASLKKTSSSVASLVRFTFFSSLSALEIQSSNGSIPSSTSPHKSSPKTRKAQNGSISGSTYSYYINLLKSCIAQNALGPGKQLHAHLYLLGLGFDPSIATRLVHLYCDCNALRHAHLLFDRIPKRNNFLWNILIRGYAWNGPYEAATMLYYQMLEHALVPDNYTFPFVLKACSALSAIELGREIHEHVKNTVWEKDAFVGAALIDMYAKCGCVEDARAVFDVILERDVILWNSMLAAYSHNGCSYESLALCREMALAGIRASEGTLVTTISASADIAVLPQGRELHGLSWRCGFDSNDRVKTAFVHMYAKCGSVKVARTLFGLLKGRDVVSWNAMISGYAMHGYAAEALNLFEEMREQSFPDYITFVGVLTACSHGGLLNEGWKFFELMERNYNIEPTVQHYTCMVDLLGHCGRLDEARNLIRQMKVIPDSGVWGALLNSCKIHGEMELAELALEKLIELEPDDAGNYVILSNIYAQAGKWGKVVNLRNSMTNRGIKKSVAYSWIEVKNQVHSFLTGDTSHPMYDEIYAELKRVEGLIKEAGYVPDTVPVFHDVEDDEKTHMICSHSERLAIAFGLITTPPGYRLLITKNLRVCEDCHVAIKFISKVTDREITIRDVNRYHHFKNGSCSCGDCW
ncbi:pentatricopeptide repeat-containing protein At4g21065-like [Rhodamnia argentea]|uniref:Pentatricopeptide repeat-containing protein At4g21065-like n=1 Tax=Rhodamnia argentea TaxID=178133 RepID=A0A8B8NVF5_9MYRT|nr:pentatricopeptide repeat-containing protein At4g21065-like [Rhodamnia argentea]